MPLHSYDWSADDIRFNCNWFIVSQLCLLLRSSAAANAMQNISNSTNMFASGMLLSRTTLCRAAVQKVADFLPQRWLLDTMAELQQGTPFSELYLNILILFAFRDSLLLNCDL